MGKPKIVPNLLNFYFILLKKFRPPAAGAREKSRNTTDRQFSHFFDSLQNNKNSSFLWFGFEAKFQSVISSSNHFFAQKFPPAAHLISSGSHFFGPKSYNFRDSNLSFPRVPISSGKYCNDNSDNALLVESIH